MLEREEEEIGRAEEGCRASNRTGRLQCGPSLLAPEECPTWPQAEVRGQGQSPASSPEGLLRPRRCGGHSLPSLPQRPGMRLTESHLPPICLTNRSGDRVRKGARVQGFLKPALQRMRRGRVRAEGFRLAWKLESGPRVALPGPAASPTDSECEGGLRPGENFPSREPPARGLVPRNGAGRRLSPRARLCRSLRGTLETPPLVDGRETSRGRDPRADHLPPGRPACVWAAGAGEGGRPAPGAPLPLPSLRSLSLQFRGAGAPPEPGTRS